jgi:hypothetical protein
VLLREFWDPTLVSRVNLPPSKLAAKIAVLLRLTLPPITASNLLFQLQLLLQA